MEDVPGADAPALPSPHAAAPLAPAPAPVAVEHWLALTLAAPLGAAACRRLSDAFPDPGALGECLAEALGPERGAAREARAALAGGHGPLSSAHLAALGNGETRRRVEAALAWEASDESHHLVAIDDPRYPSALRLSADPPPLLHVRGSLAALQGPAVAVIGARRASHAGLERAHAIARDLAAAGVVVVSGLALGTDAAAHAGALAGGGPTLAFTGTGVDAVYPRRHAPLARELLARGGAMASEFPLGHPPRPWCFPQRNRLISGASLAVVVVEAALPSGSLTTARHALEQGREVMAVPGPVDHPESRGCHALIRDGAALVTDAADVLALLAAPLTRALQASEGPAPVRERGPIEPVFRESDPSAGRDPAERAVWKLLGSGPASLDLLVARSSLTVPALLGALSALELDGLVGVERGGRYARRTTSSRQGFRP